MLAFQTPTTVCIETFFFNKFNDKNPKMSELNRIELKWKMMKPLRALNWNTKTNRFQRIKSTKLWNKFKFKWYWFLQFKTWWLFNVCVLYWRQTQERKKNIKRELLSMVLYDYCNLIDWPIKLLVEPSK